MKNLKLILTIVGISISTLISKADVHLADIFSDHMVLQRNINLKVWGSADPGEKITLRFNGQKKRVNANENGKWEVILKPMKAGGPFSMSIRGKNELVLKDILIGDVWLCSGQSNMQMNVSKVLNADFEIKNSKNPNIRLFTVPNKMSNVPVDKINAQWKLCDSNSVKNFSAAGYFFGRDLEAELGVPIGLIHSAWGGTNIETWTSKEYITKLPKYENFAKRINEYDTKTAGKEKEITLRKALGKFPKKERGLNLKWMNPDTDRSDWKSIEVPNLWEDVGYENLNGILWFSYNFYLNEHEYNEAATLNLGRIDESDITWLNGVKVGERKWGSEVERKYPIKKGILKKGENNISIRVEDYWNKGGFRSVSDSLFVKIGDKHIPIAGEWKFKVDTITSKFISLPNDVPTLLYNAMINPIIPYALKGVIWYQGESNTLRAKEYEESFPNMINNWRADWGQGDFPFLFVQLANYQAPKNLPKDDIWAELRGSQLKTLSLKNTGMAVAIDIGEENDIHPRNKQEVGRRLMLSSLKVAYEKDIVYSGPIYKSMEIDANKIVISFDNIGSGLELKGEGDLVNEFAIAGSDKNFYWAKAKIEGDKIIVWSDAVENPVAGRFAWSRNPSKFNLYNKEGLPASPFRTDNWKGITDGKSYDD